jgi:hypothetical protein
MRRIVLPRKTYRTARRAAAHFEKQLLFAKYPFPAADATLTPRSLTFALALSMYDNNSGTHFVLEDRPKAGDNGIDDEGGDDSGDDDKIGNHKRSVTQPGYSSSGKGVSPLLQSRQPGRLARRVDPLQVTRNVQLARERAAFGSPNHVVPSPSEHVVPCSLKCHTSSSSSSSVQYVSASSLEALPKQQPWNCLLYPRVPPPPRLLHKYCLVTSSSVASVERLEFPGVLRRYSVNKNELLRTISIRRTMKILRGPLHSTTTTHGFVSGTTA